MAGYSAYLAGTAQNLPGNVTAEAEKKRKAVADFGAPGRTLSATPDVNAPIASSDAVGDGVPYSGVDYGWGGQSAYNYNNSSGSVASNVGDSDFGSRRGGVGTVIGGGAGRAGRGGGRVAGYPNLNPVYGAFADNDEDFNMLTGGGMTAAQARALRNALGGDGGFGNVDITPATGPQFADVYKQANETIASDPLIRQRSTSLAEQGRRTGEGAGQQYMRSTGQGTGTAGGETQASVLRALGGLEGMGQATNFELGQRSQFMDDIFGAGQADANRQQQAALLEASLGNSNRQRLLDMLFGGGLA